MKHEIYLRTEAGSWTLDKEIKTLSEHYNLPIESIVMRPEITEPDDNGYTEVRYRIYLSIDSREEV